MLVPSDGMLIGLQVRACPGVTAAMHEPPTAAALLRTVSSSVCSCIHSSMSFMNPVQRLCVMGACWTAICRLMRHWHPRHEPLLQQPV